MDVTAVFEWMRQCAAGCRATAVYASDRGLDGALIGKLGICADTCELAQRAMDLGYSVICEELCEAVAAACAVVVAACGAVADDDLTAACAMVAQRCAEACSSMDKDGDAEDLMAMSDRPRIVLALGEVATGDGLTTIPLLKVGRFAKMERGKLVRFAITAQMMSDVVRNFRKREADVVLDYEHASMAPGVAAGDMVPAAGWLKSIDDGPDANGILWGRAELTDRAREAVAKKEIRYVSPELDGTARDKTTGEPQGLTMPSVALTNRPFLEGLPALALSDQAWKKIHGGDAANREKEKKTVKIIHVGLTDGQRVRVRLDSGEELTSDGAIQLPASPKVLALSDVQRDDKGRRQFATLALNDGEAVSAEVFRAYLADQELDAAIAAGKILPAQRAHFERLALSDLAGFRDLVGSMQPQIDLVERGTGVDGLALSEVDKVDAKLNELAKAKMAGNKDLSYGAAFKLALSERPELAQARKTGMKAEVK